MTRQEFLHELQIALQGEMSRIPQRREPMNILSPCTIWRGNWIRRNVHVRWSASRWQNRKRTAAQS